MAEYLTLRDVRVLAHLARHPGGARAYDIMVEEKIPVSAVYTSLRKLIIMGYATKENTKYHATADGVRFLGKLAEELLASVRKAREVSP